MKHAVLAPVVVAAALVGVLSADAGPTPVSSGEGYIGGFVTVSGYDVALDRPPKVTLVPRPMQTARRTVATKVLGFSGAWTDVQVVRGVAGVYDVLVTPRQRGVAAVTLPYTFEILAPAPYGLGPTDGPVNSRVSIYGEGFSDFRGRVTIGGRPARVTGWTDERIDVVVPKHLGTGDQPVVVINRAGACAEPLTYYVTARTPGGPARYFRYDVGEFHFASTSQGSDFGASYYAPSGLLDAIASVDGPSGSYLRLTIQGLQLATPTPYVVTTAPSANGTVGAMYGVYNTVSVGGFTVTVTGYADGVLEGTFSGDMGIRDGVTGPPTVTVTNGQFKVRLQTEDF